VYSNFYEIPLPALRFEKVEETDTKKVKTTPKINDAFQIRPHQKAKQKTTLKRKADSLAKKPTRKEDSMLPEQKHLL